MNNNAKGLSKHKLYKVFCSMRERCYNPNHRSYKDYGERGIRIVPDWLNDRVSFIEWSLANGWKPGLEIDRINVDGDYSPDNVRFVSRAVNAANRRPKRLTKSQQRLIKRWAHIGAYQKEIAKIFNRDQGAISKVVNNKY